MSIGAARRKADWPLVRLADVADQSLGKMLDAKKNKGRAFPYLRNPNVRWFGVDTSDLRMMPFEDHELERFGLRAGDVLICEGGEAGRAAIWDGRLPDVKFQKAIHRVRTGPNLYNRFLIHRLKADFDSGRLADYYTGATIKHLTGQDLARYQFQLPPLPEQRRIAAILDKADELRAKRRAALEQLNGLTQTMFVEMFGDPATNPRGWPVVLLPSVVYFQEGPGVRNWQFRNEGIKLINVKNIVDGQLSVENTERYLSPDEVEQRYKHFLLDAGDFVVASSGVTWGKIAEVFPEHLPLCLNTSMIRLRPIGNQIERRFIRAFVESAAFQTQILRLITGSAQPNFGPAHLKQVRIPLPPLELQREFARRVDAVERLKVTYRVSQSGLKTLFKSFQDQAFSGAL